MRNTFILLFVLALGLGACSKRDEAVMTDYTAQKASAEKLIAEVNEGLAKMNTEHAEWMAALDKAAADPKADTTKTNEFHARMQRHEEDAARVMALVDSVKLYTTAATDNDEALKEATNRLSANFNDLNSGWRNLQDDHTQLGQDIQSFVVADAGEAVRRDSAAKAAASGKGAHETVKKTTGGASKNSSTSGSGKASDHETAKKTTGGASKNSSTSGGTSSSTSSGKASDHETAKKTTGGASKNSSTK